MPAGATTWTDPESGLLGEGPMQTASRGAPCVRAFTTGRPPEAESGLVVATEECGEQQLTGMESSYWGDEKGLEIGGGEVLSYLNMLKMLCCAVCIRSIKRFKKSLRCVPRHLIQFANQLKQLSN